MRISTPAITAIRRFTATRDFYGGGRFLVRERERRQARRLTSNPGREIDASISPDGRRGVQRPVRRPARRLHDASRWWTAAAATWDGDAFVDGWTPDGRVLVSTGAIFDFARSKARGD